MADSYDPHGYSYEGQRMSPPMCDAIKAYLEKGILDDDFLQAIVCNDLRETFMLADDENRRKIIVYVAYFYNMTPSACWGSMVRVSDWVRRTAAPAILEEE